MADESGSSGTDDRTGINIDNVRDILNSIMAGRDVNITLVINELKEQTSVGNRIEEIGQKVTRLQNITTQLLSESMSELSSQYTTLPPRVLEQRLEDSLQLSRQSRQLSRVKGILGEFVVSPQGMMISEPVTFVFGGELGEKQPATHIAKALREKKIRVNFRGLNSFSRIGTIIERDSSFSEPLKVVLPAGTCIGLEGGMEFSSFLLTGKEEETGRTVYVD